MNRFAAVLALMAATGVNAHQDALRALMGGGGGGGGGGSGGSTTTGALDSCTKQNPCIQFTISPATVSEAGGVCQNAGQCYWEVCMTFNSGFLGCTKDTGPSHMCLHPEDSCEQGPGFADDTELTYDDGDYGTTLTRCNFVEAGGFAEFIVKDSNDCTDSIDTFDVFVGTGPSDPASISCQPLENIVGSDTADLKDYSCTGNGDKECLWKVFVPDGCCGNGIVETPEEQCDDGNIIDGDGCNSMCQLESLPQDCGDGVMQGNEQCDDGNNDNGDGCSATCVEEFCGDGITNNNNEECDDGNNDDGDGCSATCVQEICGDDVVQGNEECDDGNNDNGDGCNMACQNEFCGDGIVNNSPQNEECDDLNLPTANCNSNCQIIVCGDRIVEGPNEECDDLNLPTATCNSNCQTIVCGNGVLEAGEQCDDGNTQSGDGCNDICQIETPSGGDPHFTRWNQPRDSFHGECDLLMIQSDTFQGGFELQSRTTIDTYYSYIESAAFKVGDNIVEVENNQFFLNKEPMSYTDLPMAFDGITMTFEEEGPRKLIKANLNGEVSLTFKFYKHYLNIVTSGSTDALTGSKGLLGSFPDGKMLDRTGHELLDFTLMGFEWQVRPEDSQLFHNARSPQLPYEKCRMPTAARPARRRLRSDAELLNQAETACAHVTGSDFQLCIDDVMMTGDIGLATEAW
eukprot:scaffold25842_cov198-Amphora_coffeaeformis.AAC.28